VSAADPAEKQPAVARLIADTTSFTPGGTFRLGVLFTIDPHWHIYWHSPRDGGLATEVRWRLPEGWRAAPIEWPVPKRYVLPGPLVAYAYEEDVLLASEITVPADYAGEGSVTLGAELSWLVCDEKSCKIGEGTPELALARGKGSPSADAPRFVRWRAQVPVAAARAGLEVEESLAENAAGWSWRVALTFPEGKTPPEVRAFPFDIPGGALDEGRIETDGRRVVFTFGVEVVDAEFRADRIAAVFVFAPVKEEGGVQSNLRPVEVRHELHEKRDTGAVRPTRPAGKGMIARAPEEPGVPPP
jgi:hypothetical protein